MNSEDRALVCICVATYKRPEYLSGLLQSLGGVDKHDLSIELIVADNDPERTARPIVDEFSLAAQYPVHYLMVPNRGIASVRNRLVQEAMGRRASHIVFVDDDMIVEPQWLASLYDTAILFQADAVLGPYHMVLEDDAPKWFRNSGITFRQDHPHTGARVRYGSTANALFESATLLAFPGPFDERMNLSGGSDILLFEQMHSAGMKSVWCKEAIAYERWPTSRTSVRFVVRRYYRDGLVSAKLAIWVEPSVKKVMSRIVRSIAHIMLNSGLLPISVFHGKSGLIPRAAGIARGCGGLVGLAFRIDRHKQYDRIQGR